MFGKLPTTLILHVSDRDLAAGLVGRLTTLALAVRSVRPKWPIRVTDAAAYGRRSQGREAGWPRRPTSPRYRLSRLGWRLGLWPRPASLSTEAQPAHDPRSATQSGIGEIADRRATRSNRRRRNR